MTKDQIEESVARAILASVPEFIGPNRLRIMARTAIEAHTAALAAVGLVIVPREPTEAMLKAGEVPTCKIPLGNGTMTLGLGLGAHPSILWPRMLAAAFPTDRTERTP